MDLQSCPFDGGEGEETKQGAGCVYQFRRWTEKKNEGARVYNQCVQWTQFGEHTLYNVSSAAFLWEQSMKLHLSLKLWYTKHNLWRHEYNIFGQIQV